MMLLEKQASGENNILSGHFNYLDREVSPVSDMRLTRSTLPPVKGGANIVSRIGGGDIHCESERGPWIGNMQKDESIVGCDTVSINDNRGASSGIEQCIENLAEQIQNLSSNNRNTVGQISSTQ
jgi:hypothetical protein